MSLNEPISAFTSFFYMASGVWMAAAINSPEALVMAFCLFGLFAGSFALHAYYGEAQRSLDYSMMNATFAALATMAAGGPWWVMAIGAIAAAVVLEYIMDIWNYPVMGILMWIIMVAGFTTFPLVTGIGVGLMLLGFASWFIKTDLTHGLIWHGLTAAGIPFLFLGIGG